MKNIINRLNINSFLEKEEFIELIKNRNDDNFEYISALAREKREKIFGKKIFINI